MRSPEGYWIPWLLMFSCLRNQPSPPSRDFTRQNYTADVHASLCYIGHHRQVWQRQPQLALLWKSGDHLPSLWREDHFFFSFLKFGGYLQTTDGKYTKEGQPIFSKAGKFKINLRNWHILLNTVRSAVSGNFTYTSLQGSKQFFLHTPVPWRLFNTEDVGIPSAALSSWRTIFLQ